MAVNIADLSTSYDCSTGRSAVDRYWKVSPIASLNNSNESYKARLIFMALCLRNIFCFLRRGENIIKILTKHPSKLVGGVSKVTPKI